MRSRLGWFVLGLCLVALSCRGHAEALEEKIALDQLPEMVKKAALDAVKGIVLTKAEKETKDDTVVYEVEGKVGNKEYEIKISAMGKVLRIEVEDEDGPDDDTDDDVGTDKDD